MSIDFGKKEAREGYLQAKLDDLLDGINSSYGQALLDELMSRLEATINDFNKERTPPKSDCILRTVRADCNKSCDDA